MFSISIQIEAKLAIPHTEIDRVSREPTCVLCVGGFPGTALQQPDMVQYFIVFRFYVSK